MGNILNNKLKSNNLNNTQWIGIVEDVNDDLSEGRCKVRVFGKMDQRINPGDPTSEFVIPTRALPWARPALSFSGGSSSGGGSFSIPKLGAIVRVTFDNGSYYSPVYHQSIYPSDEVKEELGNSYGNSHFLIYDTAFGLVNSNGEIINERDGESIKVFFTEESGLVMDYSTAVGSSKVSIKPDNSIEIINANGDSIIMLNDGNITFNHSAKFTINATDNTEINCKDSIINADNVIINHSNSIELGKGANERVILGDSFLTLFNNHTHIGNLGAVTSPPSPLRMNPAQHLSRKNVKTK